MTALIDSSALKPMRARLPQAAIERRYRRTLSKLAALKAQIAAYKK